MSPAQIRPPHLPTCDGIAVGGVSRPRRPRAGAPRKHGSAKPHAGKCGARLRGDDAGRFCSDDPVKGRMRCRVHGGASPRAAAHPRTTHGLSSTAFDLEAYKRPFTPDELKIVARSAADPEWALRQGMGHNFVLQLRAQREGNVALVASLQTAQASNARAMKSLHEVPPPDKTLPQIVEVFEGRTVEHFEHDLEQLQRRAEVAA